MYYESAWKNFDDNDQQLFEYVVMARRFGVNTLP